MEPLSSIFLITRVHNEGVDYKIEANLGEGVGEVTRALRSTCIGISVFFAQIIRVDTAHIHASPMFIWV